MRISLAVAALAAGLALAAAGDGCNKRAPTFLQLRRQPRQRRRDRRRLRWPHLPAVQPRPSLRRRQGLRGQDVHGERLRRPQLLRRHPQRQRERRRLRRARLPACADGRACAGDNDCRSHVCTGGACQLPSCGDGFENGDETGIDCGGSARRATPPSASRPISRYPQIRATGESIIDPQSCLFFSLTSLTSLLHFLPVTRWRRRGGPRAPARGGRAACSSR